MGIFSNAVEDDLLVSAAFPETNAFGNVVNGEKNPLLIQLVNAGSKNYTLLGATSSFHDPNNHWSLIRNGTSLKYNVPLITGSNFSAPYHTYSEFRPQELGLTVSVKVSEAGSKDVQWITALNRTVGIVEAPGSWLDFQLIFLYLIIGAALALSGWWAYDAFLAPPVSKKKSGLGPKKVRAVVPGKDAAYPEVKPYEEEWIPEHVLKSKGSKLKQRNVEGAVSGGEVTSGGETSGGEVKGKKRKGKK
ncbi:hypothetical protein L202_02387 [Cryptococcus amylolentus CBS 6039]|uniref:Uncharacterized protein n=2 Tax=Cryptococcus amylolentus TaxID=104669 RepID=A0A1E3I0E9_9TREE|nr:hypothetical protein L202_02387 [Cryptococcus amylolentus CBS 6039]ODN82070.1 hypothetical protein L202_02387 [Cryptococcus amylolentus CBS 6039]ODO09812.1 hypothetical protein I350_02029 [Cryptococcus amylolentus CBS 6273]